MYHATEQTCVLCHQNNQPVVENMPQLLCLNFEAHLQEGRFIFVLDVVFMALMLHLCLTESL